MDFRRPVRAEGDLRCGNSLCFVLEGAWTLLLPVSREGVPSPRAHWKHTLVSTGLTGTHLPLQEQVAGSGPFAPRYDISHSSGKWLGFFFFFLGMSGQLWGASYIQHPAPVRGAGQGANQWASSPPHPPGCSDLFSPFLKVARFHRGSQLPLSSVAFVNFCRPARLHCLRDFMFDF